MSWPQSSYVFYLSFQNLGFSKATFLSSAYNPSIVVQKYVYTKPPIDYEVHPWMSRGNSKPQIHDWHYLELSRYITDKHSWRAALLFYGDFGIFFFFNSSARWKKVHKFWKEMWPFSLAPFTSCWVMDEREFVGGWAVGKVILSFTLAGCYAFQKTFSVGCESD